MGTASPPSSVPASPRFEWSKIGTDWRADGSTVVASGMLADERYALGSKVVRSGQAAFTFTINKVHVHASPPLSSLCLSTRGPN